MNLLSSIALVIATGLITRYLTRRKTNTDIEEIKIKAKSESLDVILKSQAILKELTEPLQNEINQLRVELDSLKPLICKMENCQNRKK